MNRLYGTNVSHLVDDNSYKNMASELMNNKNAESTDMHVDLLAASEKLVDVNERVYFDAGSASEEELEQNVDDFLDKKKDNHSDDHDDHGHDHDHNDHSSDDDHHHRHHHRNDSESESKSRKHDNSYTSDTNSSAAPTEKKLSSEEMFLEKLDILRKLGELAEAGVKLSQNYTINSDLKMMKFEYEVHKNIRAKRNAINWMSSMSLNMIYGIEMLNEKYDPFSLKLKGWSEQMNASQDDYYDVFGELYEKYSTPGKGMAPELKLLLMVSGSALKFHLSNQVINSLPNLNDTLYKDPELVEKFRQQSTLNKMNEDAKKANLALDKKIDKEHEEATRKASDLQMIRNKEIEFEKTKKQMVEQQAQIEQLKKGLSMKPNEQAQHVQHVQQTQQQVQPVLQPPQVSSDLQKLLNKNNQNHQNTQNIDMLMERERIKNKLLEDQILNMRRDMMELQRQNEYSRKMFELQQLEQMNGGPNTVRTQYKRTAKPTQTANIPEKPQTKPKQTKNIQIDDESSFTSESQHSTATTATTKSAKSVTIVEPNVSDIFQKKSPKQPKKPKKNIVEQILGKEAAKLAMSAASNDNIVSLDTVDKDEIDHISIGSSSKKTKKTTKKTITN